MTSLRPTLKTIGDDLVKFHFTSDSENPLKIDIAKVSVGVSNELARKLRDNLTAHLATVRHNESIKEARNERA